MFHVSFLRYTIYDIQIQLVGCITVFLLGFRTFSKNNWTFSFIFLDNFYFNFKRLQNKIQTISIFYWMKSDFIFRHFPTKFMFMAINVVRAGWRFLTKAIIKREDKKKKNSFVL